MKITWQVKLTTKIRLTSRPSYPARLGPPRHISNAQARFPIIFNHLRSLGWRLFWGTWRCLHPTRHNRPNNQLITIKYNINKKNNCAPYGRRVTRTQTSTIKLMTRQCLRLIRVWILARFSIVSQMPPRLIPDFYRDLTIWHKTSSSIILTNINKVLTGIIPAINNVIIALLTVIINPSFSQH